MDVLPKQPSAKGPAEMFTGDVYFDVIARGEWHWHGAAPEHFMTHLAIWEAPLPGSDEPETTWGEHVTDDEYHAGAGG